MLRFCVKFTIVIHKLYWVWCIIYKSFIAARTYQCVCLNYLRLPNYFWPVVRITLYFFWIFWLKVKASPPPPPPPFKKKIFDFKCRWFLRAISHVLLNINIPCPTLYPFAEVRVNGSVWQNWDHLNLSILISIECAHFLFICVSKDVRKVTWSSFSVFSK